MSALIEPATVGEDHSFVQQFCEVCGTYRLFVSTDESPRPRCPMRAMHRDYPKCQGCGNHRKVTPLCGPCTERDALAHELDGPPDEDWLRGGDR